MAEKEIWTGVREDCDESAIVDDMGGGMLALRKGVSLVEAVIDLKKNQWMRLLFREKGTHLHLRQQLIHYRPAKVEKMKRCPNRN